MTKTLTVELDDGLMASLKELADFEGESIEETVRIAIRGHYRFYKLTEAEAQKRQADGEPQTRPDDLLPL